MAKIRIPKGEWRFYVYELTAEDGSIAYVGKGSGCRLASQRYRYKLSGREVARFHTEQHAYDFEREHIKEQSPNLNKHPGGNGSLAIPKKAPRVRKTQWEKEFERLGSRRFAARLCLIHAPRLGIPLSNIDSLRLIAYG
jgi:hypothetical protein